MPTPQKTTSRPLFFIIAGAAAWCVFSAVGTYLALGGGERDFRRPVISVAVAILFLGGWAALLWRRDRQKNVQPEKENVEQDK